MQGCYECSDKEVTCPAYVETGASNWFPYSVNTRLIFYNNSLADTININSVEISDAYEDRVSARNPDCIATKIWTSAELLSSGSPVLSIRSTQINNTYHPQDSREDIHIRIKNVSFTGKGISDTGLVETNFKSQFYSSLLLNGNTFMNIQVIEKDTSANKLPGVYKIWIAKHHGLLAYKEYPSNNLWIKQ